MAVSLSDIVTNQILVAAGNSDIYYEDIDVAAGQMTELDTSGYTIDTTDQLIMFNGFQKVFVANGTKLGIADFINTKLTHSALGTAHAKGDILTQATSAAVMVVDYTNAAKTTTYGYVTSGTFDTSNSVTGSGSGTAFTPSAVTASPHWYAWTVYPGGASGTMPSTAYLGCLYRGRCVLSGNPAYPHQWYMSKIANPFDWVYSSTDPLTAVSGQNADAGEVGDIVRALVPYGDDFLVFGCANSIYILDGDPAAGGSIDRLDETTGMFGCYAWCKDGEGHLYFWGAGGLYKMLGGRSKPVNISQGNLPKWVDDWALNPSTHRVVLSYDPFRNGIIISKTTIADGTNLNYWYDLKLESFVPETYPNENGIYSSIFYDANSSLRNMILGHKDGYIREFVDTAKDDDVGGSDDAISSYVVLPMVKLGIEEDADAEGKLTSLTIELSGGASGGAYNDTDGVSYELHIGDDAETVMEDIEDSATAFSSGTLTGTGRQTRIRTRARGRWLGIKLYNSTASETWAINVISGEVKPAGKIKT